MKIEETFRVDAPAERVWAYLIDPRQVVQCLPGAELVEVEDDETFVGRVKVKVGPVTAAYKGRARFTELDEANRRVRMVGEGRETSGAGSAKMTMTSEVVELAEGGAEVRVEAEMDVVGKLVQFGRGMIEEVSRQLFRQFASCVQATLAQPEATEVSDDSGETATEAEDAPAAPAPSGGHPAAAATSDEVTPAAPSPPPPEATMAAVSASPAEPARQAAAPPRQAAASASAPATQQTPRPAPPPANQPVRVLPLLWRAILARIRRLFGRS